MSDYTLDTLAALEILKNAKAELVFDPSPAFEILCHAQEHLKQSLQRVLTKGDGN